MNGIDGGEGSYRRRGTYGGLYSSSTSCFSVVRVDNTDVLG